MLTRRLVTRCPEANADEFDGGEEISRILVVAGGDAVELLDAVEEALDEVSLFVEPWREGEALFAVGSIGNVGPDVSGRSGLANGVAVISFVAQQGCAFGDGRDQRFSLTGVVDLAACQAQADTTVPERRRTFSDAFAIPGRRGLKNGLFRLRQPPFLGSRHRAIPRLIPWDFCRSGVSLKASRTMCVGR